MTLKDEYELINSFIIEKNIKVEKYQHKETKFTVYNINVGGPLVNGLVLLPTESMSDDGCPHTLEHLIFLGSEDYPYKGFLDIVANISFASGTNAFTDTDHTGYELVTAGSEGFFQALPIYLDHILYPTITDQAFTTEVHHINGKGEDAGVVYCEMQECENKRSSIAYLNILRNLYTTPNGYASETGGLLKDIRELNVDTIRKFHSSFYRSDNSALIVVGDCNIEDVFKSLEPIQKKILSKGKLPPMERPWSSKPTPFSQSITKKALFPSEEETTAECTLTFEGPEFDQFYENRALVILIEYLTSGSSSPIGAGMIDCEDSYAPSIYSHNFKFERNFHAIWFESCDFERIDEIKPKFLSIIKNLVETKTFDLERIRDSIQQSQLNTKLQIEKNPNKLFTEIVAGDFLYGNGTFEKQCNFENIFKVLLEKDSDYWLGLIEKYMLNQGLLEIQCIPSIEESKRISRVDLERIEKQAKEIGVDGLKKLEKQLEDAKTYNDRPIDESYFKNIKLPSADSISYYNIVSCINDKPVHTTNSIDEEKLSKYLLESNSGIIPFNIQFNHIESLFINIRMGFNTNNLGDDELRDYLPLYMNLLTMSSIKKDGNNDTIINFELIDSLLYKYVIKHKELVGQSSDYSGGNFSQYCFLNFDIKKDNYSKVIELLKGLLCNIIIEPERIKIVAKKLLDNIPSRKENGPKMVLDLIHYNQFNKEKSNSVHLNHEKQFKFLKNVIDTLGGDGDNDSDESIEITSQVLDLIEQLKKVQNYFTTKPEEMIVAVGGNIFELESPKDPWLKEFGYLAKYSKSNNGEVKLSPSSFQYGLLNRENLTNLMGKVLSVVTPGSGSSTFRRITLPDKLTFDDVITKDYVSMYVAFCYLDQLEGPFWKKIRGAGYAYSYRFSPGLIPEDGIISLLIQRSSNPEMVLKVGKGIINETLENPLDTRWLDGAKSIAVYDTVCKEKNYSSVLEQAYFNSIRGWVNKSYRDILKFIPHVTEQDIKNAIKKFIVPLFNDDTSIIVFSSDASRIDQFKKTYPNLILIDPKTYYV